MVRAVIRAVAGVRDFLGPAGAVLAKMAGLSND